MPRPILHSELVPRLNKVMFDGKPLPQSLILDLLIATSGGVYPEAGGQKAADDMAARFANVLALSTSSASVDASAPVNTASAKPVFHSGFRLGKASEQELVGVRPELVGVVRLALDLSSQDFTVYEGVRTLKAQVNNVRAGHSQTMHSKHLIQPDGFAHAVDLVPYINGKPTWDWDGCYRVALAMTDAAITQGLAHRITWGGAWDRRLSDFASLGGAIKVEDIKKAVEDYKTRHAGPDFLDGPHFQWEV